MHAIVVCVRILPITNEVKTFSYVNRSCLFFEMPAYDFESLFYMELLIYFSIKSLYIQKKYFKRVVTTHELFPKFFL